MKSEILVLSLSIAVAGLMAVLWPFQNELLTASEMMSIRASDPDDCKSSASTGGLYCTPCQTRTGYTGQWITCNQDSDYRQCFTFSGGPPCHACFNVTKTCGGNQRIYYDEFCFNTYDDLYARCAFAYPGAVDHPCSVDNMPCP